MDRYCKLGHTSATKAILLSDSSHKSKVISALTAAYKREQLNIIRENVAKKKFSRLTLDLKELEKI